MGQHPSKGQGQVRPTHQEDVGSYTGVYFACWRGSPLRPVQGAEADEGLQQPEPIGVHGPVL